MNLSTQDQQILLDLIKTRFEKKQSLYPKLDWKQVQERLASQPEKLASLYQMEETGGEPALVGIDSVTGAFLFFDCSAESPVGRRSVCYDREAWEVRKKFKPETSAMELAEKMGIEILTEEQYRFLQTLGKYDLKTSSWISTPAKIRKLGGALFCDRRYDQVFTYHNGADSYYAARGFRGVVRV